MFTCFRMFGHPLKLLLRAAWVLKEFECSVEPLQNDHLGRGQKKLTVVERWPLWEGGGVIRYFLGSTTCQFLC